MTLCLVTGGAGFIGSSLARALVARGDRVRVIDNFSSGKRENLADIADRIELVEGDILDDRGARPRDRGGRAGVSRGGHPLGAEVDGRADREPRRQRHRHAARPRSRRGAPGSGGWSTPRRRPPTATIPRSPRSRPCRRRRSRPTAARSWPASSTRRSTRAPTASRPSACATSTSSARARIRRPSTRR